MLWSAMFNFKSTKAVVLTPQRLKGAITPLTSLFAKVKGTLVR